jgi:nicotinate dehydrogenase subunit A
VTERFRLRVNGADAEVTADPDASLLTVLRNELGLLGSRFGCGLGQCGACFVRMDGAVVPACDTPMWSAAGRSVVTVEGLAPDGELHPVQQAILDAQAAQCGFCISGIAVRAAALLEEDPAPDADTVARALDRNLCRCGAQRRIIGAVVAAGRRAPEGTP